MDRRLIRVGMRLKMNPPITLWNESTYHECVVIGIDERDSFPYKVRYPDGRTDGFSRNIIDNCSVLLPKKNILKLMKYINS